jgi:hypothetical protein
MELLYLHFIPISIGSYTPLYTSLSGLEQRLKSFCESALSNSDVFSTHSTEQNEGFGSIRSHYRNKFDVYSSLNFFF